MDAQPETSAILDTASIVPTSPVILASSKPVPAEGPVPLSFPAILRNAGLQSRFAHLKDPQRASTAPPVPKKLAHRNDNEGKRWVRRSENARFVGNPHVVAPNKRDLELSYPAKAETFPIPLPPYLPRSISLPPTTIPATIPQASYAGHFSFSLKGARKTIRRAGPRTQTLVRAIETELALWIEEGDIILDPDTPPVPIIFPGTLIGGAEGVYEVQRTPGQLVWWVQDDAWARYVIHCCARYHDVVSFSKDTPTHRLTYLLRPNRTRQAGRPAPAALATPPPTDPELSSNISSYDSDAFSLSDVASVDALSDIASSNGLSDVEGDQPSVPTLPVVASDGEADAESDLGGSVVSLGENMLPSAMQGLSVGDDDTPRARRVMPLRTSTWDRARSGSSPSRSPARRERRPPRRAKQRQETRRPYVEAGKLSFYDYLFG